MATNSSAIEAPHQLSSSVAQNSAVSSSFFNTNTVIALTIFFTLLCACIIIGHLLEENGWANESSTAILLGLVSRVVVFLVSKGSSSYILMFNEDLFFMYLLPLIIFSAGYVCVVYVFTVMGILSEMFWFWIVG